MNEINCVAFQGESGAYSEAAALEFFMSKPETRPCPTFEDVFQSVQADSCLHGMIPIENSLAGSIHQNYDLMLKYDLQIVGEYHFRVKHCLMATEGSTIKDIERVHSHPQALAQCAENLKGFNLISVPESDTAGSARLIKEKGSKSDAAIASRHAAEVYGLNVLVENLEDNLANFTRFLVLNCLEYDRNPPPGIDFKTSIVFSLENQPGSLFKALSVFALRDIDLTKIESRPIHGKPWQYMFYIDYAGHRSDTNCQRAMDHLQELATFFRILGSYPRHTLSSESEDE